MKGLGQKTLEDLDRLYTSKGYLVLDDIKFAFDLNFKEEVFTALSILKAEGYIVKKENTDCPIKFDFKKDPISIEMINVY